MVPVSVLQQAQKEMAAQRATMPPLPDFPMRPPGMEEEPIILDAESSPVKEEPLPTHYSLAAKVNPLKRAKKAGLSLAIQKKARKAARKLVEKLAETTEKEWKEVATGIVMETSELYDYVKAVSVYVVLCEAQAGEKLANRVVIELQRSKLMPKDVPFTEADFERLNAQQEGEQNEG